MEPHTEKRTTPFVATQILVAHRGTQSGEGVFTKGKTPPYKRQYGFV